MRRRLAMLLAVLLAFWPLNPAWAQSGGNCSVFRTWNTGDSLTAGDLNSSFSTVGVTNLVQSCIDGISDSLAGMQTKTDPFAGGTESLATSGAGELQRLRWVFHVLTGWQDWYRTDQNLNFATGSGVQGSGIARHVTAVGFHAWNTTSPAFPVFTSIADHQTGLLFPLPGHMAFAARDGNVNGGAKGGIEVIRWHARGTIYHHTAAISFRHSTAQMGNGQYGHVTAIRISARPPSTNEASGQNNSFGFTEGNDQIIVGHSGSSLRFEGASITEGNNRLLGYGGGSYAELKAISGGITITHQAGQLVFGSFNLNSHAALASISTGSYVALQRHTTAITPVANALYADNIVKGWLNFDGSLAGAPIQQSFNVQGVTRNAVGDYTILWDTDFATTHYAMTATGRATGVPAILLNLSAASNGGNAGVLSLDATSGGQRDCVECMVTIIGRQ